MVCLEVPYLIMLCLGITFIILFSFFLFPYRSCARAHEGFFFFFWCCVFMGFLCMQICVPLCLYVFLVLFLWLFLLIVCMLHPISVCLVLFLAYVTVHYFIYFLDSCLHSNERGKERKGVDLSE